MQKRTKLIVGIATAVAAIGIGTGVGIAGGGDDRPLRGTDYERATAAALDHVGEGTVTETEIGDGGAAYEVEIRLDNRRGVEVQLDSNFEVIGSEGDDDDANDTEEDDGGAEDDEGAEDD